MEIVLISGKLTREAEMRYTPAGTAVCNFSVATNRFRSKESAPQCPDGWVESYKGNGWQVSTIIKCTLWGKRAEGLYKYLKKGTNVSVRGMLSGTATNGYLNPRIWVTQDGESRSSFEVNVDDIEILWGTATQSDSDDDGDEDDDEDVEVEEFSDEIPF